MLKNKFCPKHLPLLLFLLPACFLTFIILLAVFRVGLVADNTAFYPEFSSPAATSFLQNVKNIPQVLLTGITGGRIHLFLPFISPFISFLNSFGLTFALARTLIFTLLNLWLFFLLLKKLKLKESRWLPLALIFLPLLFQIRPYHDPFIVYFGIFQLTFSLFLASAIFFTQYLHTHKLAPAILALIFFSLSAHSHEAQIMFWPNLLLIFFLVTGKFFTKHIWPLALMALFCLHAYFASPLWQFLLQLPAESYDYGGTTINLSLLEIIRTWITQIIATLPLNYFFGRTGQESLSYYPHFFFDNLPVFFLSLLIFGLIFIFFYLHQKQLSTPTHPLRLALLGLFGLCLWILPALPVALSTKYQNDLQLFGVKGGTGYLMVYYQYFGVALLLAIITYLIFTHLKYQKIFLTTLTLATATIFYLTYCANLASVKQVNKAYDEWRFISTQAQKSGFFAQLSGQKITLYLNHRDINYYQVGDNNLLLTQGLQTIFGDQIIIEQNCSAGQLYPFGHLQSSGDCITFFNSDAQNYFFYFDQVDEYAGYIILAPVTGFYQNIPLGQKVQIFYYSSYLNNNWPGGIYPALRRDLFTSYYVVNQEETLELKHNRQWIVRDREHNSTIINFVSEEPILLDSLIPTLIQNDRYSLQLIAPVN